MIYVIAGLVALSVVLAILFLGGLGSGSSARFKKTQCKDDWIYRNTSEQLYDTFFKNLKPDKICKLFGVEIEEYLRDCAVIQAEPDLKGMAFKQIAGLAFLLVSLPIAAAALQDQMVVSICIFVIGLIVSTALIFAERKKVARNAKRIRAMIASELPRYLDLLQTALTIGVSIDKAILLSSEALKGTFLADRFHTTIINAQMGATNWQTALWNMAHTYDVDILSDFVLETITAYEKGVRFDEAVKNKSAMIKQTNHIRTKEKASKLTSGILIPILIFKIVPILALLVIPIIIQLNSVW